TPQFFGDDGEAEEIEKLRKAVDKATKATPVRDSSDIEKKLQPDYKVVAPENRAGVELIEKSRWKFALKDTASGSNKPTLIRDMDGTMRPANVDEEYNRSWNKKLSYTDKLWDDHMRQVRTGEVEAFKNTSALQEWYKENTEKWAKIRAEDAERFEEELSAV